jgi:hypothetical protein
MEKNRLGQAKNDKEYWNSLFETIWPALSDA